MATVAVFVALGGSAWAVAARSVGTKQLKDRAVSTKKLKKNAVSTPKIRNGAVTASKLAEGVEGLQGPQGPQGPKGDPATSLWAQIDTTGPQPTIGPNEGVTAVESGLPDFTGHLVTFNQSVEDCAAVVTTSWNANDNGYADPTAADPNQVRVVFRNTQTGNVVDTKFSIAVFC